MSEDVEIDNIQERLKNKRALEDVPLTHENESSFKRAAIEFENNDPTMQTSYEETIYETPSTVELLSTPEGRKDAKYYTDNLFERLLVKRYMHMIFDDCIHKTDQVFGPYYGDNDVLIVDRYPIKFENDNIIINSVKY